MAHFKYFQVQTHVQTARESPDLNMDFRLFDNGCKQLYDARIWFRCVFDFRLPGIPMSLHIVYTKECPRVLP